MIASSLDRFFAGLLRSPAPASVELPRSDANDIEFYAATGFDRERAVRAYRRNLGFVSNESDIRMQFMREIDGSYPDLVLRRALRVRVISERSERKK